MKLLIALLMVAACGGKGAAYPDAMAPDSGSGGATGGGTGGTSGPAGTCEHLAACDCLGAGDRCAPVATACWCPTCTANVQCICGGGTYHGCQPRSCRAASCGIGGFRPRGADGCLSCDQPDCATALGRVQQNCNVAAVPELSTLCADASRAYCFASCLAQLGACAEVNCDLCLSCDCAAPATAFTNCIASCRAEAR
jgi:hypothetical protein